MKISINWIKDYVDLSGIEVDELVKRFNLSSFAGRILFLFIKNSL